MVVCPGPYPWYQFLHSFVTINRIALAVTLSFSFTIGHVLGTVITTYLIKFTFFSLYQTELRDPIQRGKQSIGIAFR